MKKNIVHPERCKSCSYCVTNCPKSALTFGTEINKKGYAAVVLDEDKCIYCGTCYNVCPDYVFEIINMEENNDEKVNERK